MGDFQTPCPGRETSAIPELIKQEYPGKAPDLRRLSRGRIGRPACKPVFFETWT